MIMPFDLFGFGKYQYTFDYRCQEVPDCLLGDGATKIFLNTRGTNDDEVPKELVHFLHYLEETTDENASDSDSDRIRKIHEQVRRVKSSEESGVRYMQAWEEKYYEREEALEEGIAKGEHDKLLTQIKKKLAKGKSAEEIADALEEDIETIQQMIGEVQ